MFDGTLNFIGEEPPPPAAPAARPRRPRDEIMALLAQPRVPMERLIPLLCRALAEWGPRHALILHSDPVALPADEAVKLGAIVTETVLNAVRHGRPADGRPATVALSLRLEPGDILRLEVKDNGPGPASMHPRPARRNGGLALVRRLATRLGGACWLENDAGARFVLLFPLPREATRHLPKSAG